MTIDSLGTLFTGELVRLAAKQADDNKLIAGWHDNAEYLRLLDDDPARPRSAEELTKRDKDRHDHGNGFEFMFRTLADDKVIGPPIGGTNLNPIRPHLAYAKSRSQHVFAFGIQDVV